MKQLLDAYGLECEGYDHSEDMRKMNEQVREEKVLREKRREVWTQRIYRTVVALLALWGYYFRVLLREGEDGSSDQKAGFLRRQREDAACAAAQ